MAKTKELQQKTKEELKKILFEQRDKLRSLRFDIVLKKIKNVREIKKTKKLIAQILTLLRNKKN